MSSLSLRQQLRSVVHQALSVECIYTPMITGEPLENSITVRVHRDVEKVSLHSGHDGVAQIIDYVDQAVFLASDVSPKVGDTFQAVGIGHFKVAKQLPKDWGDEVTCEVVKFDP